MAVQLVNGYVLVAQMPDWTDGISMILQWLTEIALAKRGYEDRASMRPSPQAQMTWPIVTTNPVDGAALEDDLRAALLSGQACVPCFPRPSYPAAVDPTGLLLTLEPTQWRWQAGDYLYVLGADGSTAVSQVQAVAAGPQLQLSTAIPLTATVVWPLVFGRLEVETSEQEDPDTLSVQCRLHIPAWRKPAASVDPVVYNGVPVVPAAVVADWGDAVNRSFAYDQSVDQIGFGAETLEIEQSYVQHGTELSSRLETDSAISDLESFLCSLGGRRGNFWLPGAERAMLIADAPMGPEFDFAVLRYVPEVPADIGFLITNTALIQPAVENDVGMFSQQQVPAAGDFYVVFGAPSPPGATQSEQPYLLWGGRPVNGQAAPVLDSVLINFGRLATDYPEAATINVRLRAYWYEAPADSHLTVQLTTYQGGTMQGGNYHGDTRGTAIDDFTNTGGAVVTQVGAMLLIDTIAPYGSAGQECGTLVYTPSTRSFTLVPP